MDEPVPSADEVRMTLINAASLLAAVGAPVANSTLIVERFDAAMDQVRKDAVEEFLRLRDTPKIIVEFDPSSPILAAHDAMVARRALNDAADAYTDFEGAGELSMVTRRWLRVRASTLAPVRRDGPSIARLFHEVYENLAPSFDYETRESSAKPWTEVPENNRNLMVATVERVMDALGIEADKGQFAIWPDPTGKIDNPPVVEENGSHA